MWKTNFLSGCRCATAREFLLRSRMCSETMGVSIARVVQKNAQTEQAELVIVTEKVKELYMKDALDELRSMDNIFEISSIIREF